MLKFDSVVSGSFRDRGKEESLIGRIVNTGSGVSIRAAVEALVSYRNTFVGTTWWLSYCSLTGTDI